MKLNEAFLKTHSEKYVRVHILTLPAFFFFSFQCKMLQIQQKMSFRYFMSKEKSLCTDCISPPRAGRTTLQLLPYLYTSYLLSPSLNIHGTVSICRATSLIPTSYLLLQQPLFRLYYGHLASPGEGHHRSAAEHLGRNSVKRNN